MRDKLGLEGIVGALLIVASLAFLAWVDPFVAAGIAVLLAGLALLAKGLVTSMMRAFGMA